MSRQPWKTYPERWNRQIIYRFPNSYGASIIAEVDWPRMVPGETFPVRDDVVEIAVLYFPDAGDYSDIAEDNNGMQIIYREVPIREVDAILDQIEAMGAPEVTA